MSPKKLKSLSPEVAQYLDEQVGICYNALCSVDGNVPESFRSTKEISDAGEEFNVFLNAASSLITKRKSSADNKEVEGLDLDKELEKCIKKHNIMQKKIESLYGLTGKQSEQLRFKNLSVNCQAMLDVASSNRKITHTTARHNIIESRKKEQQTRSR